MNNQLQGIVIKVSNLEISRAFYRDTLQLGDPVMDSNFWVEFSLPCGSSLYLEKLDEKAASPAVKSRISWVYKTDAKAMIERLAEYDYNSTTTRELRVGFELVKFYDPEGNSFYIDDNKN